MTCLIAFLWSCMTPWNETAASFGEMDGSLVLDSSMSRHDDLSYLGRIAHRVPDL
jgi:hypothetical protein